MSRVCNGEPGLANVQVEDPGTFDKGIYCATEPISGSKGIYHATQPISGSVAC